MRVRSRWGQQGALGEDVCLSVPPGDRRTGAVSKNSRCEQDLNLRRENPIGFQVQHLHHSAITADVQRPSRGVPWAVTWPQGTSDPLLTLLLQ